MVVMALPTIRIHIGMAVGAGVVLIGVTGMVAGDGAAVGDGVEDGAAVGMEDGTAAGMEAIGTGNPITLFNLTKNLLPSV
jgi:hypothetical protein